MEQNTVTLIFFQTMMLDKVEYAAIIHVKIKQKKLSTFLLVEACPGQENFCYTDHFNGKARSHIL